MSTSKIVLDPSQAQVRLIRFDGGNLPTDDGTDNKMLSYSMRLESLDDGSTYSALSYTWQPMEPRHAIIVNGYQASVGHNLWQFLRYAAQHMADRSFWIDQLCIDQDSKDELNHQVGLMSRIFGLSDRTVVWLGPGDDDTDCAIGRLEAQSKIVIGDMAVARDSSGIEESDTLDRGLYKVFSCPYWHRLWIVQEFCLSANINLVCGNQEMVWTDSILEYLSKRYGDLEFSFAKSVKWLQTTNYNVKNDNETLESLVVRYCDFGCTRKHDKVFGLMGLLPEGHRIPIDYNMPLERLVVQLFEHIRADYDIFASRHIVRNMLGSTEYASLLVGIGLGELPLELMAKGRTCPNKEIRKMCAQIEASSTEGQRLLRSGRGMVDLVGQSESMRMKYERTWFLERRDEEEFFVRGFSNLQNPYGMWQALSTSTSLPAKRFSFRTGDHGKSMDQDMEAIRRRIQNFTPHSSVSPEAMKIIVEKVEEEDIIENIVESIAEDEQSAKLERTKADANMEQFDIDIKPDVVIHQDTIRGKPAWIDFDVPPFGRMYKNKYTRLKKRKYYGYTIHLSEQYRAMLTRVLDLAEAMEAAQEEKQEATQEATQNEALLRIRQEFGGLSPDFDWQASLWQPQEEWKEQNRRSLAMLSTNPGWQAPAPIAITQTRKPEYTYPKNAYIPSSSFMTKFGH